MAARLIISLFKISLFIVPSLKFMSSGLNARLSCRLISRAVPLTSHSVVACYYRNRSDWCCHVSLGFDVSPAKVRNNFQINGNRRGKVAMFNGKRAKVLWFSS